MATLRQRNRQRAKSEVQRVALPLFKARGFDNVTVDEIADLVGLAASTIYRHFGTKEAIVLWDEHDVAIDLALEDHLSKQPPLRAIRDALVETLAGRYDSDLEFQLERVRYIYATEQVHAAAVEADFRARGELTAALVHYLSGTNKPAAPVLAGAALLALDIAMDEWQKHSAKVPLGQLISESFDALANLQSLS